MFGKLKKRLFGSLRNQLILGTVLTISVMTSIFILEMTHRQEITEITQHSAQVTGLANMVATSSGVWVLSRDYSGLQEIIQGTSRYPNLRYVIVLDLKGQVLAHKDPSKIGLYLAELPQKPELQVLQQTKTLIDVISPIMLADRNVGWVRIGLDQTSFYHELAIIQRNGFFYIVTAVALGILFSSLVGRYLTRRLYMIQQVADTVQRGVTGARAVVTGDDEAAILAQQFNFMLDSLDQRENQLQSFYKLNLVGMAITAPNKGWIRINACLCKMLGYSEQELRLMTWEELTYPEDLAADVEQFNRLMANEIDNYSLQKRFISRNGNIIYTKLVVSCVRKANKEVDYVTAMIEDISESKRLEEEHRQIDSRLELALEFSGIGVWDLDLIHDKAWRSIQHDQIFGYNALQSEWTEENYLRHIVPEDRELFKRGFEEAHHTGQLFIECRIIQTDQSLHWINKQGRVIYDEKAKPVRMLGTVSDITARKLSEVELKIAAIAFEAQEGMLVTDADNNILRVNSAFTAVTGYTTAEVKGKNPRILQSDRQDTLFYTAMWESINNTGAWQGELWNRRKNGEIYPEQLIITAVKDQDNIISNYVATFTDISLRNEAKNKIERLAFYDPLTGLPNRRLLQDRLKPALASSQRSGRPGALLFIDLDNFKALNDTLGHNMGDLLLQRVAQRLESCVRENDIVARLGGDEFVVMLEDLSDLPSEAATQTEVIGHKILDTLNQCYQLDRHEYRSTPSIGATLFNGQQQAIDDLLKQADIAMYQAKASGRNALRFFDPHMQASITARVALEKDLRLALEEHQFMLYYQPQVSHTGQIMGAEALIRWQHPLRGLVSPAEFIPVAEETLLILPIGLWVLETACAQIKCWEDSEQTRHLQLAVNVSSRQFYQADFVMQVTRILNDNAISPAKLKLELTESLVLDDIDDTVFKMKALREIGVFFSMDDFGTGYSSLSSLKKLPLDQLKIDQSFIRDIATDPDDAVIVETIIAMGNKLGMEVIAEGVETEAQRNFLEQHGCLLFQGYLFSKPVPLEQFNALL